MTLRPAARPLAVLALLAAAPLAAQAPADTLAAERPAPGPRSALFAGAAEYLVPTLGHAYAGDWTRGLPPAGLAVLGAAVAVAGAAECSDGEGACGLLVAGVLVASAGKLWGVWSAVDAAHDRNRAAAGLRPALSLGRGGVRMGVSLPPPRRAR